MPGSQIAHSEGLAVSVGKNIKRLRTVMGLRTQKALADLLGAPQSQVSDWENDRSAAPENLQPHQAWAMGRRAG